MPNDLHDLLSKLLNRHDLHRDEARRAFEHIMSGRASEVQIAALLMGLAVKGPTIDEIVGAASVMRERAVPITCAPACGPVIDTCGTGGDVKGTFNISTAAALIAAAAGVTVVKHGNRSASSKSGSADVLEKLGVRIEREGDELAGTLEQCRICFAFARSHHPAMKHVGAVRSALGIPTIFNLLGPLTNPARAPRQVIGVFAAKWTEPLATVLKELGSERAWVVYAEDGLDELSTMSPTRVSELNDGTVTTWTFDPASVGLARPRLEDLQVHSIDDAAAALVDVLAGKHGPKRDIALLNAAAALVVAGMAIDLTNGMAKAAAAIDSGAAKRTLDALIEA